jgi:molybdopterin-containing oxidoreductase family iron-sulfur binding subunit
MESVKAKGKCGAQGSPQAEGERLDLAAVREQAREKARENLREESGDGSRESLSEARGPELWRSLDEIAGTAEFREMLHREFPRHASEWPEGVSRRAFLQLSGASLGLAGLTACTRQPVEKVIPYVRKPEQIIPGKPLFFATALSLGGYATGVLAESHEGRPTKIEGNPEHPASFGATDVYTQASVLTLYDPDRSQKVLSSGRDSTWSAFVNEIVAAMRVKEAIAGEGLRFLTGTVTSPLLAAQIADLLQRFPKARWHRWEAAGRHQTRAASRRAFGRPLDVRYDLRQADVLVTLDSDLLTEGPGAVVYARQFADRRRLRATSPAATGDAAHTAIDVVNHVATQKMNRLYAVESAPTRTGTLADHRLQLPPAQVEAFAVALAEALGVVASTGVALSDKAKTWIDAVAQDLKAHAGRSLVVADEYGSTDLQVLVHGINAALGNLGKTVLTAEPVEVDPVDHLQSLSELVADMKSGAVDLLVMLDGVNPVYTAPVDLDFAAALEKVRLRVHHGLYEDETSEYCHWHLHGVHELEGWSDARAFEGTISIVQPLIEPLYGGKSAHEVLAVLGGQLDATGYDLLRKFWDKGLAGFAPALEAKAKEAGFPQGGATQAEPLEANWRRALHTGFLPGSELPAVPATVDGSALAPAAAGLAKAAKLQVELPGITLLFRPDPTIYDGRFASNAWLQEVAKPITKLSWDNAVLFGPKTAERLKIGPEDTLQIGLGVHSIKAAAWVLPGVAENTAVLTLGYGRRRAGKGTGQGFNAYALRTRDQLWAAPGLSIHNLGERFILACTQNHHVLHGGIHEDELASTEAEKREVIRTATLAGLVANPQLIAEKREIPTESMYPPFKYEGHAWGMAIDLSVCTGCNACVVACQSENNIPVVGKDQVLRGREMHWLRIDRYFASATPGDLDEPTIHHQPLPCMHCENAPCEVVCPVAATTHSDEGLNDMTYNRCVGTRYCSNNCPYKVRRFNFLRYADKDTPVLALLQNPDVTVRMRGVMEKCSYCVQRIEEAKITSKVEEKPIPADGIKTACQQVCPSQAIAFGDINQPDWQVTQWKQSPLSYGLLEEVGTRPRTTYLAKLSNPNSALAPARGTEHGHA